jgi:hypothetical protein
MIFTHSGKYGDIIWALPAMKSLSKNYVNLVLVDKYPFFPITEDVRSSVASLLEAQDYISSVGCSRNVEGVDANCWWIDEFCAGRMKPGWNIPRFVCDHFKLPYSILDEPWLKVTPNKKAKYVFCRNTQDVCKNEKMDWNRLVQEHGVDGLFLGWGTEYHTFVDEFGYIPHYETDNLLQAAEIIAGAEKVFCGQSVHHSMAEALKKDIMLEVSPAFPSVCVERPGVENIR